jgi:hypothetical protein
MGESIRIVRAVQTAMMCPSQWDLWDADDNYYYARYRHGCGELRQYQDEDWGDAPYVENPDDREPGWGLRMNPSYIRTVTEFYTGDEWDGFITLEDFAGRTGIILDPQIYETGYGDHVRDELIKDGMVMFLEMGGDEPDQNEVL